MTRKLFTFCSAMSLLLCLAVRLLWSRSYAGWTAFGPPVRLSVGTQGRTQ
jgi:hypothetical protein